MRSVQDIPLIGIGMGLIVVVGLIAGVGGIVISDDRPPMGQAPPINDTTTAEGMTQSQSESVNEPPQTYAVTAQSATAIDTQQLAEYGEVGTQADDRIELRMPPSDVSAVQNISWVTNVRPVIRPEPAQTGTEIPGSSEGVGEDNSLGVQQAHQNGITGEGVEVGIIDNGFDSANPAITSNVAETRSFQEFGSEGDPAHGTSVAEVVTRVAPGSQLYLASADTGTDTKAAIDYLRRQDVDIIVHSASFVNIKDDGDHFFTDEVNAATDSGTLFVNSAGNYAQTHWEGDFRDTDEDGFHEWTASGDERNALPDSTSEFSGGEVRVSVHWDNEGDSSDYKPYLYNPVTEEYIVEGQSGLRTETNQYARISADVAKQPLSVVIENTQGPANDEIEVIVFEGPEEIQRNIPASSITAPADVPAVLAVAAYERGQNQLAPYSSRGPTDDGRTGIGVTGYTNIEVTNGFYESGIFGGTSAAAPYVGGVAALVEENQAGDQSPTELTSTLKSSSDDILDPGTDTASGSGVVNAADAVDVAEGTLTGEIRGQEDIIADVGLEVSLERQTSTGGFEQIRTPRQVSDGRYTFEGLATGEEYRVVAEFQGESGSATVEELRPGTNTRDIVIEDITVSGITSSDVTLSDSTSSPGSEVNVTVTATPDSTFGTVITQSFNQTVAFASGLTVQVGGSTVAPQELSAHSINRSGITVAIPNDEVSEDEQIRVTYTITTANTTGKTVEITGEATNLSPTELPERVYRITPGDDDADDGRESDSVSRLTFEYSDFGGSINLEINDDRRVESTLSALDEATVGGATVEVPQASTRSEGLVVITGEIDSISVGGQEFNIDNVTFEREGNPVATVEFDSLTPTQSRYEVGDEFTSSPSGMSMSVEPFIFSDGDTFRDGSGSRRDSDDPVFAPTNVNLRFNLSSLTTGTGSETPESPTGVITGNIRTIDDNPVQDVAQLEIQLLRGGTAVAAVQADPNGEYSAEVPVASGSGGSSYTVEVDSPRFEPFSRQLTVFAGATERLDIRLQESSSTSTSAIDATRSLTSTEVTNGSTVTVTVEANFESSIDDAKLEDSVDGPGITRDNITITDSDGAFLGGEVRSGPRVDATYNDQLNSGLGSDNFTVKYEVIIPEDTPVGTTITFDGTVTNDETSETAGIDGDSSVEVVATTSPDTVTVNGQEVPAEFTSETENGERTVTVDNVFDAVDELRGGDIDVDTIFSLVDAFRSERRR